MKPLSPDLRQRIHDALQGGQSREQVAARFCVSLSSVQRIKRQGKEHQHLDPKPLPGRQRAVKEDQAAPLKEIIATQNDWTLQSRAQAWHQHSGTAISASALHPNLHWLGYSYTGWATPTLAGLLLQKKSRIAAERDPHKRAAFTEAINQVDPKDLVFLDECGFSLALHLLYGWGPMKERLVEAVPAQRGVNLSVLGAFDAEGRVAITRKEGAMKRVDVEAFLREDLLARLLPGSVLVLDNARIHHGGDIEKIVLEAGCSPLYLPPYSPDLSPIELAWGWSKRFVRRLCPRDQVSREGAIEKAVAALPAEFATGWFRKCGYSLS